MSRSEVAGPLIQLTLGKSACTLFGNKQTT